MSNDSIYVWNWWEKKEEPETPPKKCECGVTITMGKDDSPEYHSDWCPIKEEYEKTKSN